MLLTNLRVKKEWCRPVEMVGINNKNLCVWLVVSPVLLPVCPPPSKVSSELELAALTIRSSTIQLVSARQDS